jgi:REP element-mobilizing transposase RayT
VSREVAPPPIWKSAPQFSREQELPMAGTLTQLITATDAATRNQSLDALCAEATAAELLVECEALDQFRRGSENLYERVRALFFLYAIHRFHLPGKLAQAGAGLIPFKGYEHWLNRRFEEAIECFLDAQTANGPSDGLSSALAAAYHRLAFQTLANQVRRSVRTVRGNQWMFRMGHPADQPLRVRPELLHRAADGSYPILRERTPVRMDLTHCGWSDIFFLGMDYPEGAKVLNVSIDLGVHGRDTAPRPPVEAYLRVIEEPLLRLVSVDLGCAADITHLAEVFDFAKDYLGLLKAAVIASGIVPPGIEGSGQSLEDLLARMVGPGRGLEIVSRVNDIPKGSRLAVSTTLLAALVAVCMRATGQAHSLGGQLRETERRLTLARALLGEWLSGSGGGWQDSGGLWPGMKLIEGALAAEGDPESGISRGRLMPTHRIFTEDDCSTETRAKLQESLVLVHGGMAQNVGPILEMVTEKYLLRCGAEWEARLSMLGILGEIMAALKRGDVPAIGAATTRNFRQPIQTIIPWASNYYTESLIAQAQADFGKDFWGFWMLGGMSGGGMGFIFAPQRKAEAQTRLQEIMSTTKRELQHALPFAMEPVVYDFAINERGTFADLLSTDALMPAGYYALIAPPLLKQDRNALSPLRRAELDRFGAACRTRPELRGMVQTLFDTMLPRGKAESADGKSLEALLEQYGFDRAQHEHIRTDLKDGRIGLAQNRLPANAGIEDVQAEDVTDATAWLGRGASLQLATVPASFQLVSVASLQTATQRVADTTASHRLAPLPFVPFDKHRPASIRRRYLPHWRQEGATYFVTFRLADSLPASFVENTLRERDEFLRVQGKSLTPERREQLLAFYRERIEAELDKGHGGCVLRNAAYARIVEGALRHFDGQRYWLGCFAVMPNHVHVIVRPIQGPDLSDVLRSWKSFTAREINRMTRSAGQLWQHESFDHIVRDEHELERISSYVQQNPARAGLGPGNALMGHGSSVLSEGETSAAARQSDVGSADNSGGSGSGASLRLAAVSASFQLADAPSSPQTPTPRVDATPASHRFAPLGLAALKRGEAAVVTLAAGAGSRWTQGAGVVKALHPFCELGGEHRTFIETHLAKSRRVSRQVGAWLPHIFTTSYLSHEPTQEFLSRQNNYGYEGPLLLSPGRFIGLRLVPTVRDLRFMWEELPQQLLDEQAQKVRESLHAALIGWARGTGEASDYTDNLPLQCLHPVGHWYEIPNLLRNGVLGRLLAERPQLKHLMLHNIDTLGADVDPALLGLHIESDACLTFEVITKRIEDRGGGLARVNGRVRLVEGLAMPREEVEFGLSYYNSNTCWIDLDKLLAAFGLKRADILASAQPSAAVVGQASSLSCSAGGPPAAADARITTAIRALAAKMPTYITVKDVKKRWGHGQEDVFPVCQFEKLWVDMSSLPEIDTRFVAVPRFRGQQLKDQAQLDGWLRDGSAAYVESLCEWK